MRVMTSSAISASVIHALVGPVTLAIPQLHGAIGSAYVPAQDRLYFVEYGTGAISVINHIGTTPAYAVLGAGYASPEDIAMSADGAYGFVTERTGHVLRFTVAAPNCASATELGSGLTAPHQMVFDEAADYLYLVEFADPGRLIAINVATNTQTTVAGGFHQPIGLLLTENAEFAYVTEQLPTGRSQLVRVEMSSGRRDVLYTSSTAPLFFMRWMGDSETAILVTERDPANTVWLLDLATTPVAARQVATVDFRPSSVSFISPTQLSVCCDAVISLVDLTSFSTASPIFMGIGFVPVDRINASGNADTSMDPGYFFQVKESPFGGTLHIQFNHDRAYSLGARYYRMLVDGVPGTAPWSDYQWDPTAGSPPGTGAFVLRAMTPITSSGQVGYFTVHQPSVTQPWYNHWLGYLLDTSALANDTQHTISIELYRQRPWFFGGGVGSQIGSSADAGRSATPRIENRGPVASINQILHDGASVGTCAIVDSGSTDFSFQITATHPAHCVRAWSLSALWGDDQSASVASASYTPPPANQPGVVAGTVPAAPWNASIPGDPTSIHCAHTFYLWVYDRVIDGYNYLHGSGYHKSITIYL